MDWIVYIILCNDNSLYTGITTDIEKRFHRHASNKGAKYFRGREPMQLVYQESGHDRSSATKREFVIKKLSKLQKNHLISSPCNELKITE